MSGRDAIGNLLPLVGAAGQCLTCGTDYKPRWGLSEQVGWQPACECGEADLVQRRQEAESRHRAAVTYEPLPPGTHLGCLDPSNLRLLP